MNEPLSPEAQAALERLLAEVQADPTAHDFFALLRRVDALRPHEPRTGEALRPRQEALRLGQAPELDFAPAALAALQPQAEAPPRLLVRFFGLLGPQGPMPLHLTEFVRDRLRHHDDPTLAHFLDLFHHRMLSLFYRAWAQAQPVVQRDRPAQDRFRHWVMALAGALPRAAESHSALPPDWLALQAGWLGGRSAHPEMLCKVLGQLLQVPVRVEEHVGHWLEIEPEDRTRLGHAANRPERSARAPARLGVDANAGRRAWDRQFRFRLHLGPLSRAQYDALLPGTPAWAALAEAVRHLAGRSLEWDVSLHLAPEHRRGVPLSQRPRLGVASWCARPGAAAPADHPTATHGLRLRHGRSFLERAARRPAPAPSPGAAHA